MLCVFHVLASRSSAPLPPFQCCFRSACVKTNSLESVFNIEMGVRGGQGDGGSGCIQVPGRPQALHCFPIFRSSHGLQKNWSTCLCSHVLLRMRFANLFSSRLGHPPMKSAHVLESQ